MHALLQKMESKSFIAMKHKEFFLVPGKIAMNGAMKLLMETGQQIQEQLVT